MLESYIHLPSCSHWLIWLLFEEPPDHACTSPPPSLVDGQGKEEAGQVSVLSQLALPRPRPLPRPPPSLLQLQEEKERQYVENRASFNEMARTKELEMQVQ